MRDIPRMTAFELLNQEIHGDLRELRPLVRIDDPPTERILPLDLPLITLTDETAPDGDISLGSHAVHEDRETLLERILPVVRANPQAATVLAQLLRATEGQPIEHALLAESYAYSLLQSGDEFRAWLSTQKPQATRQAAEDDVVQVVQHPDHTEVRLNRAGSANALDQATRSRLADVCAALEHSEDPIVLTGAGRHFCAGGDLREFGQFTTPVESHFSRTHIGLAQAVARLGPRLSAHIHGACIGAGIELTAFAAQLIAHPGTRIRLPEVAMGLIPGAGGTVSVPRRIGRHRALQLMLDPAGIDAHTALAWGLIDAIEPNVLPDLSGTSTPADTLKHDE